MPSFYNGYWKTTFFSISAAIRSFSYSLSQNDKAFELEQWFCISIVPSAPIIVFYQFYSIIIRLIFMQKKLLVINWRDIKNPEAGGAEVYYHEMFKRIAAEGKYAITVLSHTFPGAMSEENMEGLRVIRRGGKYLFNFAAMVYVRKHQNEYNLIIEDLNKVPFFTPLFVRKPRMHMVMHFFGASIFKEAPLPLALYIYLMEKLVPFIYRRDPFSVISNSTYDEVSAFCQNTLPVKVLEPGVDLEFFKPVCSKQNPPYLLYIGRIKKYKNIQFIIQGLKVLRKKYPDLELFIAGSGDYTESLNEFTLSLGLQKAVHFTGYVPAEEKRRLLSGALLMINAAAKEGWGITNIEANACGTVSVSSRVPGLKDSVKDGVTGILFKYGDLDDFVNQASRFLSDNSLRLAMEKEALVFSKKFTWDRIAKEMTCFIEQIL